jgi:hypothetical protein
VEFRAKRSKNWSLPLHLENDVFIDTALLDLGAVSSSALDFKKLARDCELLREAFLKHPEKVREIVAAFQPNMPISNLDQASKVAKQGLWMLMLMCWTLIWQYLAELFCERLQTRL